MRVANDLEVARSTVVRIATRFAAEGLDGLLDQRRHNGAAKVDERFRRRVVQLLQRTRQDFGWMRPTWTRELLGLQLLHLLASKYRSARRIHVVLDNYGIHHAKLTNRTLAALGDRVVLHFLPPYCPDANRIERIRQELHANVTRNHRCKTINELLHDCREYVKNYRWRRPTAPPRLSLAA